MRRAARTDANHAEIRDGLRKAGASVKDMSHVGGGIPDLLVYYKGVLYLFEVKNLSGRGRRLTASEARFGERFPVWTVTTLDEALMALGLPRAVESAP